MNENKSKIKQMELVTEGIGSLSMLPKETEHSKELQNKTNTAQSGSSSQTQEQMAKKERDTDNNKT